MNAKKRVELRPPTPLDKEKFFDWRNDREIWRWCRQSGPITYAQHLNYWSNTDVLQDRRMFSILPDAEASVIQSKYCSDLKYTVGCCGLTSIDHINRRAEFSCYIGPEHQRKGYARSALTELFNHGFDDLNLNVIWGETFDGNPALNLFVDLGMTVEGTRREFYFKEGRYLDATLVSVRRDEWNLLQHV